MPKEVVKEDTGSDAFIDVRWGQEHYDLVQVGIDRNSKFVFVGDSFKTEFTSLNFIFRSREDVDRFVKALQKAKRKAFKYTT